MQFPKSKQQRVYLIGGFVIGALTPFINRLYPKQFAAFFVICVSVIIASLVAYAISTWYIKRGRFDKRLLNFLFWSNLVAWIIPILGLLVGSLTNQINLQNHGKDRRKYMVLGSLGFLLSILHFSLKLAHIIKW